MLSHCVQPGQAACVTINLIVTGGSYCLLSHCVQPGQAACVTINLIVTGGSYCLLGHCVQPGQAACVTINLIVTGGLLLFVKSLCAARPGSLCDYQSDSYGGAPTVC